MRHQNRLLERSSPTTKALIDFISWSHNTNPWAPSRTLKGSSAISLGPSTTGGQRSGPSGHCVLKCSAPCLCGSSNGGEWRRGTNAVVRGRHVGTIYSNLDCFFLLPTRPRGNALFRFPQGAIDSSCPASLSPSLRCGPCDCLFLLAGSSCPRRPPLDRKLNDESVSTNLDVSARG